MTQKQRRRPMRRPANGAPPEPAPTALEEAVNGLADGEPPPQFVQTPILVHAQARKLTAGGSFTISAGTDPAQPIMFVGDNGAWRAIFAEPGTHWEIRPKEGAAPRIWQPGMQ